MKIRDAELKDAQQLDALLTKLIHEEARYDPNLNSACEIKDNYCDRIGINGHKILLIEEGSEIAGYLYGFIYHIPGMYQSPIAIIDALFIDEKYRRKGYASRLIDAFRVFASKSGACQIELKVISENQQALDLYKKLSFSETKKYMKLEL